ncbi:MAG: rhomboid family intramembrane serine protease [Acidobacteria bacterium]|nr:rhomboid family intramembrane serine protease [Acidobacteriota bacterium]
MIKVWDNYRVPGRVRLMYYLIAINVLALMATMDDPGLLRAGGVVPFEWFSGQAIHAHRAPILITVIWSMFLHGGWSHVFWNMLFLLIFGRNVEAKLKAPRFFVFYISCGIAGFLAHVIANHESTSLVVGASGAISGLMGAYLVWFGDHMLRIRLGWRGTRIREFEFPVWMAILMWLMPTLLNAFLPLPGSVSQVSYISHVGGFAWGFFLAKQPIKRKSIQWDVKKGEGGSNRGPFVND